MRDISRTLVLGLPRLFPAPPSERQVCVEVQSQSRRFCNKLLDDHADGRASRIQFLARSDVKLVERLHRPMKLQLDLIGGTGRSNQREGRALVLKVDRSQPVGQMRREANLDPDAVARPRGI